MPSPRRILVVTAFLKRQTILAVVKYERTEYVANEPHFTVTVGFSNRLTLNRKVAQFLIGQTTDRLNHLLNTAAYMQSNNYHRN